MGTGKYEDDKRRRAAFVTGLSNPRYGAMTLRALAIEFLDIDKIDRMSDVDLLRIPGIGRKALEGVRKMLQEYRDAE